MDSETSHLVTFELLNKCFLRGLTKHITGALGSSSSFHDSVLLFYRQQNPIKVPYFPIDIINKYSSFLCKKWALQHFFVKIIMRFQKKKFKITQKMRSSVSHSNGCRNWVTSRFITHLNHSNTVYSGIATKLRRWEHKNKLLASTLQKMRWTPDETEIVKLKKQLSESYTRTPLVGKRCVEDQKSLKFGLIRIC